MAETEPDQERFLNTRDNVFKSIHELSKKFRKIYANELFICIFELVQEKKIPMISLANMTDKEKKVIRLYLVKAILNLNGVENEQIYDDYSREVTSGATIFRTDLLPELLKLVKNRKTYESRLMSVLFEFWRVAKSRVWLNTCQGLTLDSDGKKECRLQMLARDDRKGDSPPPDDDEDNELTIPAVMPPYPHRPHPEGHYWWNPDLDQWRHDDYEVEDEYELEEE